MKETYRYTIILHKFTKNHDHRLYCYWDMVCDGCNCCFSSWAIFCPFTPLTTQKIQFPKISEKKYMEISSLNTSVPKIMIICFTGPEIWHMTDVNFFFHFALFFALLPSNSPKKWKFQKNVTRYIIILHKCAQNHDHMLYCFWDMAVDRCICFCYFSFWKMFRPFTPLTA